MFSTIVSTWIRRIRIVPAIAMAAWIGNAADLNPAAVAYQLPNQIKWVESLSGSTTAILFGERDKPGRYIEIIKWKPHSGSRPHFHPHDRFITVLSGTWWVGTGAKYDPASMVAMPAGSFIVQYGNQVHYDGTRDEEAVIQITGDGPTTSTAAEAK